MGECFLGINLYNHFNCRTTTAVEEVKHLGRSKVHRVRYKKYVLTECWSRMDATQSSTCDLLYEYRHFRLAHSYSKINKLYLQARIMNINRIINIKE